MFTTASTTVIKTFACDEIAVKGERFLRADYSLSCQADKHAYYSAYAMVMVLVSDYPTVPYCVRVVLRPNLSWNCSFMGGRVRRFN